MKPAFVDILYEEQSLLAYPYMDKLMMAGLISFSFTDRRKKFDKFQLNLENVPVEAADTLIVEEDDDVLLVFGVGDWSISRKMTIDEMNFTYGDTVSITITGRGGAIKLQEQGGKVWLGKTDSEVVEDIAHLYGLTPQITPTTVIRAQLAQGTLTYAQLLAQLADENDYIFKIENDTLYFQPRDEDANATTTLYYNMGDQSNIEEFTVNSKRTRVKSGGKVAGSGKNKGKAGAGDEKTTVDSASFGYTANNYVEFNDNPLPGSSPSLSGLAGGTTDTSGSSFGSLIGSVGTKQHTPGGTKEEVKKRAEAKAAKILWKAVEATCNTRNIKVFPTERVNIMGIAKKHSGAYYCDEVTYALEGESLKTTLKLKSKPFATKKATTDKKKKKGFGNLSPEDSKDKAAWGFSTDGYVSIGK